MIANTVLPGRWSARNKNILSQVPLRLPDSAHKRNSVAYSDTSLFKLLKFLEMSCDSTQS